MTIKAKLIADSVCLSSGRRLTTIQLRYPRFIHAELLTHRVFSRNASSSRAIPVERLIEDVLKDTARPIHWGKNKPGMQADEETAELIDLGDHIPLPDGDILEHKLTPVEAWFRARDNAVEVARGFMRSGYHKQIVNRLLEPFAHINVIVTSTEWDNWNELRDHADAQPEIRALARCVKYAMEDSEPVPLDRNDWHLPYINDKDRRKVRDYHAFMRGMEINEILIRVSAARCARVSYLTHDLKTPTIEKDLDLFERLAGGRPLHASPLEHQATPAPNDPTYWGNFQQWAQFRKFYEESVWDVERKEAA